MVNISSKSLIELYNKFQNQGLLNLNIRKYIKQKNIDDSIVNTIDKKKNKFWFLNNGITIACKSYQIDGSCIHLYNFSIVNGGQTTHLIGNHKSKDDNEFFIPCKIIANTDENIKENDSKFFNEIAEATNSQKPIKPRDLKSNAPEMIALQQHLREKNIILEIKRGEKDQIKKNNAIKIKNEELAQILYSFVNQRPGIARSNKKSLFENNAVYKKIFYLKYPKDKEKSNFLVDLIKFNEKYSEISEKFTNKKIFLKPEELNILKNGKTTIFALFGIMYRLSNNDLSKKDFYEIKTQDILQQDFKYGKFYSNYQKDDIDKKIIKLIREFTFIINDEYQKQFNQNNVTSVSNFFKTDLTYYDKILKPIISYFYRREEDFKIIKDCGEIFLRKSY